jgi:hypothetical protein
MKSDLIELDKKISCNNAHVRKKILLFYVEIILLFNQILD